MRHAGDEHRRVISVSTHDAGVHWTAPTQTTLPNPDAALSAVVLEDGRILAVLNEQAQGRDSLSLAISADGGKRWETIYRLEDQRGQPADEAHYLKVVAGLASETDAKAAMAADVYAESAKQQKCDAQGCGFEFSYPYLIRARNGDFHLVYTWNRSFIKHVIFNQGWLDLKLEAMK
jgi:predicted neuraminidase